MLYPYSFYVQRVSLYLLLRIFVFESFIKHLIHNNSLIGYKCKQ